MAEDQPQKPEDILREILAGLRNNDATQRLSAILQLRSYNYSSEAIRNELEKLAINDENQNVSTDALAALDLPAQRHVRSLINKVDNRFILLNEINDWEKLGLLDKSTASVLRKRYDFDAASKPAQSKAEGAAPVAPAQPKPEPQPAEPRPTLLETLLSETSIKIALYLGAFFVVASAAILAALSPALRLPVLIIASFFFGGLSLAIRKRLPQPSFALFIVFSFLLPITANVLEESLSLSPVFSAIYWVIIFLSMAIIWGSSTWLYESRVFSITSFIAFSIALYRIGDVFEAEPEFYSASIGIAVLAGLLGVWILKKWKDAKFSLPLFFTAQLLQAIILGVSLIIFGAQFIERTSSLLWNIASIFTWGFAFLFYILSDILFPFILFSWFAALTLLPLPWFLGAAFEFENTGLTVLFLIWGLILSIVSEATHRVEVTRKFSLAILLVSIPTFALTLINAFNKSISLGFAVALGITFIYTLLHLLRVRRWLWALALLNFIIAYFAFFNLPLIEKTDIFFGYQLLGLSILFLLPDLFSKNDLKTNMHWRVPPRMYGVIFTFCASIFFLASDSQYTRATIGFAILMVFFAIYTLAQRKAFYGYIPAAYLALTILYALDHFKVDAWLPALTALAVFYFVIGVAVRSKETWSFTLRNSALVLGVFISFAALFILKETGGWYALLIGLLFTAEMYLRRNGLFEIGMPVLFTISAFLILRDLNFERFTHHVFVYSLVWILTDLLAHLTFTNPRPLKMIVRIVGGLFAIISYGFLITESYASFPTIGFGIFTLLFLTVSLVYRQPNLFYTFTLTLPLFVTFLFRNFDITKWIHPVIFVAMGYYACGFFLRLIKRASGWDSTLLFSGLGLGVIVSIAAPILGGLDAAIPIAFAATLWAAEAFARKNVWLGFPANTLYLLAYFVILGELNVDQPQFYSMGAALLGLLQHYLLTRTGSKTGAFIMGMLSQLTLLGTTYIQMVNTEQLVYFVVLFFQSMIVLFYGLVIRSRSLTFTPIVLVVLGVITVLYTALKGLNTVVLIGCTGIILLMLGILAVMMRERIVKIGERLSDWKA